MAEASLPPEEPLDATVAEAEAEGWRRAGRGQWISMDFDGFKWIWMDLDGFGLNLMELDGFRWI